MGKKKYNLEIMPEMANQTLLESFRAYVKEHPATEDIIGFLSVQNAQWLVKTEKDELTDEEIDELEEFYYYFMSNYGEKTEKERFENWGQEPLILRMAEQFIMEDIYNEYMSEARAYLNRIPANGKLMREANALCDLIFRIRKDRVVSCAETKYVLRLPGTIPREELDDLHLLLLYYCAKTIRERSGLVVRVTTGKNTFDLFGIEGAPGSEWIPLPAEEMMICHCTAPNGAFIPPEKGVRYIGVDKKAGYTGKETAAALPQRPAGKPTYKVFNSKKKKETSRKEETPADET